MYKEEQYFRQPWILLLMLTASGISWYTLLQRILFRPPFGTSTSPDFVVFIFWLIAGIGLPVLIYLFKMFIEVLDGFMLIRIFPFINITVHLNQIEKVEIVSYNLLNEYWRRTINRKNGRKRIYSIGGNQGLEIFLLSGERILIGTEKPEKLCKIISNFQKIPKNSP